MADIQLTAGFTVVADQLGPLIAKYSKPITIPVTIKAENVKSLDTLLSKLQNGNFGNAGRSNVFTGAARNMGNYTRAINDNVVAQKALNKEQAAMRSEATMQRSVTGLQRWADQYSANLEKNSALMRRYKAIVSDYYDGNYGNRGGALQKDVAQLRADAKLAGVEVETLSQKMGKLFGQHWDTAVVMLGINALRKVSKELVNNVADMDKAVVDLQIASGKSRSEVQGLMTGYSKLGKELGATTIEVAKSADTFLRQGKSFEESETLIRNSMMLSKLGQIDADTAATNLTSAMKGYKLSVEDSISVVDKLTAVDMAAAVSAGDISQALQNTSVSANVAGISLDRLIGYISVVGEVTQASGEEVGKLCA